MTIISLFSDLASALNEASFLVQEKSYMNQIYQGDMLTVFRKSSVNQFYFLVSLFCILFLTTNILIVAWMRTDRKSRTGKPLCKAACPLFIVAGVFILPFYMARRPQGELSVCMHCGKPKLRDNDVCYHCGGEDPLYHKKKKPKKTKVSIADAAATFEQNKEEHGKPEADAAAEEEGEEKDEEKTSAVYSIETMTDGAVLFSLPGQVISVNQAFTDMTGYSMHEMEGKNMRSFLPGLVRFEDNPDLKAKFNLALSREAPFTAPITILNSQKHPQYGIVNLSYIRNEEKKPVFALMAITDISDIRQAEDEEYKRFHAILTGTAGLIATIAGSRDDFSADHHRNVAKLAYALAGSLGMNEEDARGIYIAGMVHDCGKIKIPGEILNKPERLTPEEYEIVKQHPRHSYELLAPIEFPWPVADTVLQHHERLNSTGYPAGLANKDILPEAKILAVADVVAAMTHKRPWRPAHDLQAAAKEIHDAKGVLYEPKVVDACLKILEKRIKKSTENAGGTIPADTDPRQTNG